MSTNTGDQEMSNLAGENQTPKVDMHIVWFVKTFFIVLLAIFVVIDVIRSSTDVNQQVKSFSYHAYENNSATIHSPFLGKVRLVSSDIQVEPESDLTDKMKQSACENKTQSAITLQKCKMMRTPTVYLGKIHSSWSALGAQSVFTLVKNIGFILITFIFFSWIEEQIRTENSTFRTEFRFVRSMTVVVAIIALTVNVILDLTNDMHELNTNHENKAVIGSITTGFYFCLVSIIIICFSHLDDPYNEETLPQQAKVEGKAKNFVQFYYGSSLPEPTTDDANKRLHEIYGMLHTSHLLLVIFPLVLILALVKTQNVIVDVHLQLIFFSSIFLAVLDIIQTRVFSVLANFQENSSIMTSIGKIKLFVSLAFLLAKAFVYVPSLQIILVYYTKLYQSEWWLVFFASLLFGILSVLELVYLLGLFVWTDAEAWLVSIRKTAFFPYGVSLVACLW
jgi:hypothetical protein